MTTFLNRISEFFGLHVEPAKGQWPRKVGLHERPPERIPILPKHLRPPLPPGVREVSGPDHRGWEPLRPQQEQRQRYDDGGIGDYLRDGFVIPKKRDQH